jgi:ribosomal protein S18 acetylase RimI-like enzyme
MRIETMQTAGSRSADEPFPTAAALGLNFRPIGDADLPFLARLYATTRAYEMTLVPWSEAEKAAFVDMQFRAQHLHYQRHYADAQFLVIERAGEPAGRLYLHRGTREHCIVDIAFLPQHCGQGLGTAVLTDVLAGAAAAGTSVTIHVEKNNPALRLYLRLGFAAVEDKGIYVQMRRAAPAAISSQVKTA